MLRGALDKEKKQAAVVGRRARVVEDLLPNGGGDWTKEGVQARKGKAGSAGEVFDYSNSHGLCFGLKFEDGSTAWFDPDELEEVK